MSVWLSPSFHTKDLNWRLFSWCRKGLTLSAHLWKSFNNTTCYSYSTSDPLLLDLSNVSCLLLFSTGFKSRPCFLQTSRFVAMRFWPQLNCIWRFTRQHWQFSVQCPGGCVGGIGRVPHCLNPAGEQLYWIITASARQHQIVLLFWQWSAEGVTHNEFLLIFSVMSSNCVWLASWLLFSHLLPEVPLLLTFFVLFGWGKNQTMGP